MARTAPGAPEANGLVTLDEIRQASHRLQGVALRTPLVRMDLSGEARGVWLKSESLQPIGSFKLRGAYNKIASLSSDERSRGVITYSSGNHGQGVAYASRLLGVKAVVVMPANAPRVKQEAIAAMGAEIVRVGPSSDERKTKAEQLAEMHGYSVIPPYDDRAIIAGQGTCGIEIVEDLPKLTQVFAPVGGGGLLSGIAAAVKQLRPEVRVIGVEPELAADAAQSFRTGEIAMLHGDQTARTIADGLRTQSVGHLNFEHLREYVDDVITVSEEQIRGAMRRIFFGARLVSEPSGAVAAAGAIAFALQGTLPEGAVAVVSGGNVEINLLCRVLEEPH
jgi:threonine dehydratase